MISDTLLESKLLVENLGRKNFVDSMRLDIVNGRDIKLEQVKEAIKYLQEDSKERGEKQVAGKTVVKKPAVKAESVDAEALMQSMFKL